VGQLVRQRRQVMGARIGQEDMIAERHRPVPADLEHNAPEHAG
jgi:hypothetical protein